jgi:hypothetical protein
VCYTPSSEPDITHNDDKNIADEIGGACSMYRPIELWPKDLKGKDEYASPR